MELDRLKAGIRQQKFYIEKMFKRFDRKTRESIGWKIHDTSMAQEDMEAFTYPATFDTDFQTEYFDEFWLN